MAAFNLEDKYKVHLRGGKLEKMIVRVASKLQYSITN